MRVQQTGDPSYSTYDDLSSYTGVKVSNLGILGDNVFVLQAQISGKNFVTIVIALFAVE